MWPVLVWPFFYANVKLFTTNKTLSAPFRHLFMAFVPHDGALLPPSPRSGGSWWSAPDLGRSGWRRESALHPRESIANQYVIRCSGLRHATRACTDSKPTASLSSRSHLPAPTTPAAPGFGVGATLERWRLPDENKQSRANHVVSAASVQLRRLTDADYLSSILSSRQRYPLSLISVYASTNHLARIGHVRPVVAIISGLRLQFQREFDPCSSCSNCSRGKYVTRKNMNFSALGRKSQHHHHHHVSFFKMFYTSAVRYFIYRIFRSSYKLLF